MCRTLCQWLDLRSTVNASFVLSPTKYSSLATEVCEQQFFPYLLCTQLQEDMKLLNIAHTYTYIPIIVNMRRCLNSRSYTVPTVGAASRSSMTGQRQHFGSWQQQQSMQPGNSDAELTRSLALQMGVMSLVEDAEVSTGAASVNSHLASNMLSAALTYHPSTINSNFTLPPHSAAEPDSAAGTLDTNRVFGINIHSSWSFKMTNVSNA